MGKFIDAVRRRFPRAAAGVAVVAVAVGGLVYAYTREVGPVDRYRRVAEGMSREQVVEIVGAAPWRSDGGPAIDSPASDWWQCDGGALLVVYGPDGRAASVVVSDERGPPRWSRYWRRGFR